MSRKLGKATLDEVGTYLNTQIIQILSSYRKTVASYIPASPEDIDKRLGIELLVSPKLDGELWYLLYDKDWILVAPNGRSISGNIEILDCAKSLQLNESTIYAGELHVISENRTRIGDLTKILAEGERCDTRKIGFAVFDVVTSSDLNSAGSAYSLRFEKIQTLPQQGNLFVVPTEKTKSSDSVHQKYEEWVISNKLEGLIARTDDARTYKVKPSTEFDAAIIGFTEKRLENGDLGVRTILVGLQIEDGSWIPLAAVGNIGDNEFRKELYAVLKLTIIPSSYRKTSESSGVMYQFVEPKVVAEFRAVDIQPEDASGKKIKDPILSNANNGWKVVGWTNSVSVHNPTLVRLRNDKSISQVDIGWNQITRLLPVENTNSDSKIAESEIINRRVWTKDDSVRKLVIWKTNKESIGYPNFVVHWTDYSPTRKAPLAREVRLAPSQSTAEKIAEDMISENIKKGWQEIK